MFLKERRTWNRLFFYRCNVKLYVKLNFQDDLECSVININSTLRNFEFVLELIKNDMQKIASNMNAIYRRIF